MNGDILELPDLRSTLGRRRKQGDQSTVYLRHSDCLSLVFVFERSGIGQFACLLSIDSLLRFESLLRNDDDHFRPAFFATCDMKLIQDDLIPLLKSYPDDEDISYHAGLYVMTSLCCAYSFCVAVTVMTLLTMPVNPETIDPQRQVMSVFCLDSSSLEWWCHGGMVDGTAVGGKENHSCISVSTVVCLPLRESSAEAARNRHWETGDLADVYQESIGGRRTRGALQG